LFVIGADVYNQGRNLQGVTQQLSISYTGVERRLFSCGK
jgi:hypothetical protein